MNSLALFVRRNFSALHHVDKPICRNCKFFLPHEVNYPDDEPYNDALYGRCKRFGQMDLVTGQMQYEYARSMRADSKKCGPQASHFLATPTNQKP